MVLTHPFSDLVHKKDLPPCKAYKSWYGGYTGMKYVLVCDRTDEHGDDHHWVHGE